jgi:hypothetical protein
MAKTPANTMGMSASLKPRLISDKRSKVYSFVIPKFGRFAYTRDPGEAKMFLGEMFRSHLGAIIREPDGRIIDEIDLGSGLITNIGVTALANDSNWQTEAAEPINTLNVCKYHDWGTGATAAAQTDFKLQTKSENEAGAKKAVAATSSVLSYVAAGNAKLISTGKLTEGAAGPVAITEWGLFSGALTEGEAGKVGAGGNTATSFSDTAKLVKPGETASAAKVRGAQNYILSAYLAETEKVYGLITKNTAEVATVPAWVKEASAATGATPVTAAKYTILPVMWDHRVFAAINVEKGNTIEFPYELTIEGGH